MWQKLVEQIQSRGISFDHGLSDTETSTAEQRFGFRFPPDLRAFLQTAAPRGRYFPDWRSDDIATINDWLDRPREGIVFDIEHNGVWLEEWGSRPDTLSEAITIVNRLVLSAPKLIPIYQHRMMPSEPHLPGNPVFSVHQTDIIVYGSNLRDYLAHEFLMTEEEQDDWTVPSDTRRIEFWDTDRFQEVRWENGSCVFDNSRGQLP